MRDGTSGLQISLLCETHSSGATRKEQSLPRTTTYNRLYTPSKDKGWPYCCW